MYALNLDNNGRILSATFPEYAVEGMMLVESLPDGDITDYLWIDGAYKYDPVPIDTPAPTLESRIETVEADTADLKEALNMILNGVTE